LLDRVLQWDAHAIRCSATSHRDPDNPLREAGGLATLAGIEYAAQAVAVHGSLLRNETVPRNGVLGALKNVTESQQWLHEIAGDIVVEANLLHSDPAGGIFSFAVLAGDTRLLSGQFTLMYIDAVNQLQAHDA
ncbi:MAG: 3-hydroxylacyl-ACP dehydratase, partial [Burkholderiales bacterium]|nr:3-hydroxylacyl-ACP dehydratase [Burkholderiales bacterium]